MVYHFFSRSRLHFVICLLNNEHCKSFLVLFLCVVNWHKFCVTVFDKTLQKVPLHSAVSVFEDLIKDLLVVESHKD